MRAAIVILVVAIIVAFSSPGHAAANTGRVAPRARLNPGEFTWHPETSPKGPVLVVVSLPQQHAYVYRNGVLIGRSTVSTGREGKETPTGAFTVLQKKAVHAQSWRHARGDAALPRAAEHRAGADRVDAHEVLPQLGQTARLLQENGTRRTLGAAECRVVAGGIERESGIDEKRRSYGTY